MLNVAPRLPVPAFGFLNWNTGARKRAYTQPPADPYTITLMRTETEALLALIILKVRIPTGYRNFDVGHPDIDEFSKLIMSTGCYHGGIIMCSVRKE